MKQIDALILVDKAQIAALRFLRSGAASASLAKVAAEREQQLESEVALLEEARDAGQSEFNLVEDEEELPLAVGFSRQAQPKEGK